MNDNDDFMAEAKTVAEMLKRLVRDKIITGALDLQRIEKYLEAIQKLNYSLFFKIKIEHD